MKPVKVVEQEIYKWKNETFFKKGIKITLQN